VKLGPLIFAALVALVVGELRHNGTQS